MASTSTVRDHSLGQETSNAELSPITCCPIYFGKSADNFTLEDASRLILCDLGEAFAPAKEPRLGRDSRIPDLYRAPETFFEPDEPISYASDIWSLAITIYAMLGGRPFIRAHSYTRDHVADHISALGIETLPIKWQEIWNRTVDDDGSPEQSLPHRLAYKDDLLPQLEECFEEDVQKYRKKKHSKDHGIGVCEDDEKAAILEIMRGMLCLNLEQRLSVDEILKSEWMVKWALPEQKKAAKAAAIGSGAS